MQGTRARTADNVAQVRKFLRFVGDLPIAKDGGKILAKNFFDPDHVLTKDLYEENNDDHREENNEQNEKEKKSENDDKKKKQEGKKAKKSGNSTSSSGTSSDSSEFEYGSDSDVSDTRSVLHAEREEIDLPTLSHSLSNTLMLG